MKMDHILKSIEKFPKNLSFTKVANIFVIEVLETKRDKTELRMIFICFLQSLFVSEVLLVNIHLGTLISDLP